MRPGKCQKVQPDEKKTLRFVLNPEDLTQWSTAKRG
jgi:hypothetical protein